MLVTSLYIILAAVSVAGIQERHEDRGDEPDYKEIDSVSPPYFLNSSRTLVYTTVGRTVTLVCRVRNLGHRAVSWIRKSDLHILTVGVASYTNEFKFLSLHPHSSDEWNLRVTNPTISDSGPYECQVNTEPKLSRLYHLHVVVSKATILGDRDVFVQSGSDINLTCSATSSPEPPSSVTWLRNRLDLHRSTRGGIAIVTEKRRRTSNLLISRVSQEDSGNYTCVPSNAESDAITVHVLKGGLPRANMMAHCDLTSPNLNLLLMLLVFALSHSGYFSRMFS